MAISYDLAKKLIECVVGGKEITPEQITPNGAWYFGLSSQPIVNGQIPNGAEPTVQGYKRKAVVNGPNSFNEAKVGTDSVAYVTNKETITMDEITADSSTQVQYFFLSTFEDNSNSNNAAKKVEMWGAFDRARPLVINSNLIIEPNGAVFKIVNVD